MPARIASRANPLVRRTRLLLSESRARRAEASFVAEGVRLGEEAIAAGVDILRAFHSPRLTIHERGRALLDRLAAARVPLVEATDAVLDGLSDAETAQGIVCVVREPEAVSLDSMEPGERLWVIAWGLQDPGNLGTLMRTADAAGADLFVTVAGAADPTSPKAVRASAGSIFRLRLARNAPAEAVLETGKGLGIRFVGTDPSKGVRYDQGDYLGALAIVFGREGEGLPAAIAARLDQTVTIPMRAGVESLNVAAAAAVILFEAARRRRLVR